MMNCKKCVNEGTIILRNKDFYCEDCFTVNTNHKFRACIGKNKILSSNEKVLVCLSGGVGSAVLLDLIYNGMCMENHKKLRITPYFLHLINDTTELNNAQEVLDQCSQYNFDLHMANISDYMVPESQLPSLNNVPLQNTTAKQTFQNFLNKTPASVGNDLLPKIKRTLFIRYAKLLQCNFVFTAETTTTLASNLLSNLALGRGSQVQDDVGFCDSRDDTVTIIRPMREISKEELDQYVKLKQLKAVKDDQIKANSLQSVIKAFVTDLQESFPATISTVCKTADKIGIHDKVAKTNKCLLCQSEVGTERTTLTAFDATNFSRTVSNTKPQDADFSSSNKSLFPFAYNKLCFSCSRNYSEILTNKSYVPKNIQHLLEG